MLWIPQCSVLVGKLSRHSQSGQWQSWLDLPTCRAHGYMKQIIEVCKVYQLNPEIWSWSESMFQERVGVVSLAVRNAYSLLLVAVVEAHCYYTLSVVIRTMLAGKSNFPDSWYLSPIWSWWPASAVSETRNFLDNLHGKIHGRVILAFLTHLCTQCLRHGKAILLSFHHQADTRFIVIFQFWCLIQWEHPDHLYELLALENNLVFLL